MLKGFTQLLVIVGSILPGALVAQEWVPLNGSELEAALNDTKLQYENAHQVFYKSGRTLYDNGRSSWGYWSPRGDFCCSQWPPADGWDCYQVERHSSDKMIRFVSDSGYITDGTIVE